MTTLVEQLQAVESLLEDPARWTNRTYARSAKGDHVEVNSYRAVAWCLLGACRKANGFQGDQNPVARALAAELGNPHGFGVDDFNDSRTHAEVLELVRKAKATAIAEEATGETQAS